MNQYSVVIHYGLRTGDRLVREKGTRSPHHGIYVGIFNGIPLVAENQIGAGIQYIPLGEFLRWSITNLTRVERFQGNEEEREAVMSRINRLVGKRVDLINFNGEHFAGLIQNGKAVRKRVTKTFRGIDMFLVFLIAGRKVA